MNERITMSELKKAIAKQKNSKTPGPDGLPAELYKCIQGDIQEQLLITMNKVLEKGQIPESWREAYISLIPKENTDSQQIQNYRPISLLNADYKIFVTILADRLKQILRKIIHIDQNGFLPGRQIKNNLRIIMDILEYYELDSSKQIALMFLDAQKAFDNVNWDLMKEQIRRWRLGENFSRIIEAIYQKQSAKILINGELTEVFRIEKGTRQGRGGFLQVRAYSLEPVVNF